MTNVYKTTTIDAREGNTPLDANFAPKDMFPKSVYLTAWMWVIGAVLNAWGLSGPGLKALLDTLKWQKCQSPAFISIMPTKETSAERRVEVIRFRDELMSQISGFECLIGLQINASCPNAGVKTDDLANEIRDWCDILAPLKERRSQFIVIVK